VKFCTQRNYTNTISFTLYTERIALKVKHRENRSHHNHIYVIRAASNVTLQSLTLVGTCSLAHLQRKAGTLAALYRSLHVRLARLLYDIVVISSLS